MVEVALHDPDRIDWSAPFWVHATPEALTGCWLWSGSLNSNAYGIAKLPKAVGGANENRGAHRIAWLLTRGPIPSETPCVLHRCDVRACVNPAHMFLGTHSQNMADMASKGRNTPQVHRLDAAMVVRMRVQRADGWSYREIADAAGVRYATAYEAVTKKRWGWL